MKIKNILKILSYCTILYLNGILKIYAQNPIIQTHYTADPAPMVYKDRVYLYTSHDEDSTLNNFFTMYNWRCYSTTDMVNWTDHGIVASLKNFNWHSRNNGAWAPQCIERNGKFYLYVPIHGEGIAVLVSDSPTGPFHDPLGHRLIVDSENIWHDIDPTVFIDDDGQAYLFWGNPKLYYVKLNEDMISYNKSIGKKGIVSVEMTGESFGIKEIKDGKIITNYTEGPWLYKRNNIYYLIYAAAGIPEYIAYSTAPTIEGPWTYRGFIMERAPQLAFTNHAGVIDYKGRYYFFYHSQELSGEGFKRSVCVEEFEFNPDGTIPLIIPTKEGVKKAVDCLNPYKRVEAETMAWSYGLKTEGNSQSGVYVTKIENNDFLKVRSVDFAKGPKTIVVNVASGSKGGKIEIRLDSSEGELLGVVDIKNTGGWQNWKSFTGKVKKVNGIHDVCFVFKGDIGELFNFDWWRFKNNF